MPRGRAAMPAWERYFNRRLGRNIIAARRANGVSGVRLAALLGIDPSRLCNWEHGRYAISVAWLQRLAGALGLSLASLIPGSDG
jgi:transcriptional regulator with XRE-family HTH domain